MHTPSGTAKPAAKLTVSAPPADAARMAELGEAGARFGHGELLQKMLHENRDVFFRSRNGGRSIGMMFSL